MELKENDTVYTDFGYGVVITPPGKPLNIPSQENSTSLQNNKENETSISTGIQTSKIRTREPTEERSSQSPSDWSSSLTKVQLRWGGVVSLEEKLIRKKIKLNVKTFYGSKKTITFEVDINMTIEAVRNLLLSQYLENTKMIYNIRLIYPMGTMQELNVNSSTVEQYNLPDKAHLILLVQTTFAWDSNLKGSDIKLSNGNLTANKTGEMDYQFVLGSLQMTSGRHYWEVKIDKYGDEEDLFIGIARKEIDLNIRPLDSGMFWGYMCCCAKKVGAEGEVIEYGYDSRVGDVIGVLLEYKSEVASLSFYRNGARCGTAFSNLAGSFVPAVCMNYGDIQVTLDPKAALPFS